MHISMNKGDRATRNGSDNEEGSDSYNLKQGGGARGSKKYMLVNASRKDGCTPEIVPKCLAVKL